MLFGPFEFGLRHWETRPLLQSCQGFFGVSEKLRTFHTAAGSSFLPLVSGDACPCIFCKLGEGRK